MLIHILYNFTKEDVKNNQNIEYIRVLGFSNKGKTYLNKIKKDLELPIVTTFSKNNSKRLEFEMQTTGVYSFILDEQKKE